ncbi:LuxR C-terminal-related transcriptional regulator [Paraburkholderia kirstenboschensis]|uniref:LuxR C-terminal-related transcriptional regulator n=1 Tax=Paraburkholderia kirstenboschensis TaxID=1245436 RepID=UPI003742F3E4
MLNKQIAYEPNLSEITVKIYRGHVMKKMASHTCPILSERPRRSAWKPRAGIHRHFSWPRAA